MSANETGTALYITEFWPDPAQSAAGRRQVQIIRLLESAGFIVTIASTAQAPENMDSLIHIKQRLHLVLNTEKSRTEIVTCNPKIVVFDRFLQEEKWGWIFDYYLPHCLKITDTSDFYSLRSSREKSIKTHTAWDINTLIENPDLLRELSSIYKSDLSLIISDVEYQILTRELNVHPQLLLNLPFRINNTELFTTDQLLPWNKRQDLVFVGQYKHAPNIDCIEYIQSTLWSKIQQALPGINMHIYGAGFPQSYITKFNAVYNTLQIRGVCEDIRTVLNSYRILFAPLRFGAGQKGKFIDAMCSGTPIITSTIGAEGMWTATEVPNSITLLDVECINSIVQIYNNDKIWSQTQQSFHQCALRWQSEKYENAFGETVHLLLHTLTLHRNRHIAGRILKTEAYAAQKYKYRFIEEKNKKTAVPPP